MAIVAGSKVIVAGSITTVEQTATRPKIGVVESAAAGPPGTAPVNVVVDWEDGTTTTYVVSDRVLYEVTPPTSPSKLGSYVQLDANVFPVNRAGQYGGRVVMHFNLATAAGVAAGEVLAVQTPRGFIVATAPAFVTTSG